jgi:tRNA (guanine37-N1)-methyltransferase
MEVPEVLRSGNHEAIRAWRLEQALARTRMRRPDLLFATNRDTTQ